MMAAPSLDHFGLGHAPFSGTTDPASFYPAQGHQQALDWIAGGVAAQVPVLALTGGVGTGKTALAAALADRHGGDWTIGLVPGLRSPADAPAQAARALGLAGGEGLAGGDAPAAERIRHLVEAGRPVLLIADDAQALGWAGIAALAGLAGQGLTLLLLGRPELRRLLALPALRRLVPPEAQAILPPLAPGETAGYVAHRLDRAGAREPIFDPGAMQVLEFFGLGVPRMINIMADHCLSMAAARRRRHLDGPWVRAVLDQATAAGVLTLRAGQAQRAGGAPPDAPEAPANPEAPTRRAPIPDAPALREAAAAPPDLLLQPKPAPRVPAVAPGRAMVRQIVPALYPAAEADPPPAAVGRALSSLAAALLLAGGAVAGWLLLAPAPGPAVAVLASVAPSPDPGAAALMRQALAVEATDPAQAALAYARAAIRGGDRAAYYLGQLQETGAGIPRNLALARLWYGAADLPAARQRLAVLPLPPGGAPGTPVPVFQARLEDGRSEVIWTLPDDARPARFRIESTGPAQQAMPVQETTVPGAILPFAVSAWRVVAVGADGTEGAPSALTRMAP